ncbi:MAG: tripartite tricarboxylate transporter TctB family protein [Desulfobacteraceae bacterium]|nr:MAG: tripartite tricarboxylate transporter TctB family protein [Desulfobacteraceae bacterium]
MKRYNLTSSLFWLLVSILVFAESLRLGAGTLQNPGMGFMTMGASAILGILSLVLLAQTSFRKEQREAPAPSWGMWQRVVFVIAMLTVYSLVMPRLGYLISTFVLLSVLFRILEEKKTWSIFVAAFLATLLSYVVFSKWLNCQFPDGLFGF